MLKSRDYALKLDLLKVSWTQWTAFFALVFVGQVWCSARLACACHGFCILPKMKYLWQNLLLSACGICPFSLL